MKLKYKTFNINYLAPIFLFGLMMQLWSCENKKGDHSHRLISLDSSSIIYLSGSDTLINHNMESEIKLPEVKDSLTILIQNNNKYYSFSGIPADYANQNCTVEFSTNEFKDYFPVEWAILKDAGNFATLRLFIDNGFFNIIVINSLNGTEIARHAEKY
jgi:hypothetical protein